MFKIITLMSAISIISSQLVPECLDGAKHKPIPTSENSLFAQCAYWKQLSCCSSNTTIEFHILNTTWYGFNYNHCGVMSEKCRNRFLQDLCLYECDPYLGKWIVQESVKKDWRSERYFGVPLCKRDCDLWFEDCKEDYTCRDNWNKGFLWKNGTNYCRHYEPCRKFKDIFETSESFCNSIWDSSFNVTSDPNCISFIFNTTENPNKIAAAYYTSSSKILNYSLNISLLLIMLFLAFYA